MLVNMMNVTLDVPVDIVPLSLGEIVYRSVLFTFGFIVNTCVFCVIACSRQLHYPRHVFWAAVGLFNNLSVVNWIFDVLGIALKLRFACRAFTLNAGVTYTLLLNSLCLATVDRYLAIAHYEWYKVTVSNRLVILALLFSSCFIYATATSPFWIGWLSLNTCTVNLTHIHWMLIWDLILGITCVALDCKIFKLSRTLVKTHVPTISQLPMSMTFAQPPFTADRSFKLEGDNNLTTNHELRHAQGQINNLAQTRDSKNDVLIDDNIGPCCSERTSKSKPNRLETRAALHFSMNVLPFWLCTFPITLGGIGLYWCVYFQISCPAIFPLNRHLKHLFFIHYIYNPLAYALTAKEFQRALKRFTWRFKTCT